MALIHEQLYRSRDLANIDFSTYLEQLVGHLVSSYGGDGSAIRTELDIDPQPLNLDCAIPCGLIVNELVANSIEHAFPDGKGTISVRFKADNGRYRLELRDDGTGFPEGSSRSATTSLGLKLVEALATQLGAEYGFASEGGSEFRMTFEAPAPSTRERARG